jgi:hypothetical protein
MSSKRSRIAKEIAEELSTNPEIRPTISEAELDALLERLEVWSAPAPSPERTEALIERLRPLVPVAPAPRFRTVGLSREPLLTFLGSLPLQARLLGWPWWAGAALALPVGYLLAEPLRDAGLSPAAIAPPLVVLGLLWVLRPMRGAALQIELTAPVSPAQVLLGRLLLTTGTHLGIGALLWLLLGAPGALLLPWAAALFLFSGLTLLLTLWAGTVTALVSATALWALQLLNSDRGLALFGAPWATNQGVQSGALLLGLILMAVAIGLAPLQRLTGRAE